MEIIARTHYQEFLDYLPAIKSSLKEWQFVDIRLTEDSDAAMSIDAATDIILKLFKDKQGKIYPCGTREALMLIRWGQVDKVEVISEKIETSLPAGKCKIVVQQPTPEGLGKLEILIRHIKAAPNSFADIRRARRENVVLLADDDMYIRALVKKGAAPVATVHEVANGSEVVAAYKQYMPDMVFLDIHLPGRNGMEILSDILALDPETMIIMLSSDSSPDNVKNAMQHGAKGFMAKPFTKEKLMEHLKKCPTFC